MNKAELLKLEAEIKADYDAEIAAVRKLLERFAEKRDTRSNVIRHAIVNRKSRSLGAEEIIQREADTFDIPCIDSKMVQEFGRGDYRRIVAGVINKLRQREEIEEVVKGVGSRSGVYRCKKSH